MTRRFVVLSLLVGAALVFATNRLTRASMSPEQGQPIPFEFVATENSRTQYRFLIEVERVGFLMNSVRDKYKLVRMRVENHTPTALQLSADKDRLELFIKDSPALPGLLNMQTADGPLWDSLATPMRQTLAYPASVKAARAAATPTGLPTPEVLLLFGFFAAQPVTDLPAKFVYSVESLGKQFTLVHRAAAARD